MSTPTHVLELRKAVGHDLLWLHGVTGIVRCGDKLLLGQRADTGAWSLITGIIDPGEQPGDALVRELREEANVTVRVKKLLGVRSGKPVSYPNGDVSQYLDVIFECEYAGGEAFPADGENLAVGWFDCDQLPALNDHSQSILDEYLSDRGVAPFLLGCS